MRYGKWHACIFIIIFKTSNLSWEDYVNSAFLHICALPSACITLFWFRSKEQLLISGFGLCSFSILRVPLFKAALCVLAHHTGSTAHTCKYFILKSVKVWGCSNIRVTYHSWVGAYAHSACRLELSLTTELQETSPSAGKVCFFFSYLLIFLPCSSI